jgi:hypothetical protein
MASTELLSDTRSRSEAEVEQILPSNEHVPDPRDLYASDSPVLEYDIASDQELYESADEFLESRGPEVQEDRQVGGSFAGPCVCLYVSLMCLIGTKHSQPPQIVPHQRLHVQPFTTPLQTAQPSSSRQILPPQPPTISAALLSCRDEVGQEQDVTPGGHSISIPPISCPYGCSSAGSQNADRGQHQVHTTATRLPSQVSRDPDCAQGNRDSSSQKIRRRGAKENALAVSPRPL